MQWREWLRNLTGRCASKQKVGVLVVLGMAGMVLILLSSLLPARKPTASAQTAVSEPTVDAAAHTDAYVSMLETRLTTLLQQMEGVGSVSVMVTVQASTEQIYAEEVKESQNAQSSQSERALVLTKRNGEESALVSETRYPAVQGVVVLCSGGASASVRERIFQAVSTVLDISTADIFVGKTSLISPS